jgi:hypothetical protein
MAFERFMAKGFRTLNEARRNLNLESLAGFEDFRSRANRVLAIRQLVSHQDVMPGADPAS